MIKEIKHVVLGIAFSPAGQNMGAMLPDEANKIVSDIAKNYDEVQTHINRSAKDEAGDPAFVNILYVFVKYADGVATAKSK